VWWARRSPVASRPAGLASLLPEVADRGRLEGQIDKAKAGGLDLDEVLEEDLQMPVLPESPLRMADLHRVISRPDLNASRR